MVPKVTAKEIHAWFQLFENGCSKEDLNKGLDDIAMYINQLECEIQRLNGQRPLPFEGVPV